MILKRRCPLIYLFKSYNQMKKRLRECYWVSLKGLGIYPIPNHLSSSKVISQQCSSLKSEVRVSWKRWCWRYPYMSLTGELPSHLSCQNLAFSAISHNCTFKLFNFSKNKLRWYIYECLQSYDLWMVNIQCTYFFCCHLLISFADCFAKLLQSLLDTLLCVGSWGKRRIFSSYSFA